jgi:hypothetical protein
MAKSKYIREAGNEPTPPRERFTNPSLHFPTRYADLDRDMPKWRDFEGRWRCRWCGEPCPGKRTSWCSHECERDGLFRAGIHVRYVVEERDKGICAECGLDTKALERIIEEAVDRLNKTGRGIRGSCYWRDLRRKILAKWGLAFWDCSKSLWEADHIRPVEEGGGACGVEGYQTLCVWCHKAKTARKAGENAGVRAKAMREKRAEHKEEWNRRLGRPKQADLFGEPGGELAGENERPENI